MKKLSKFKKMKNEASSFLAEELEIRNFNRFSAEEIQAVRNYYPDVDKPFIKELLDYRLSKCLPIKLNFDNFVVDIKIDRRSEYLLKDNSDAEYKKIIVNEVITNVSISTKKVEKTTIRILSPVEETSTEKVVKSVHKLTDLLEARTMLIVEIGKITSIHNELCRIFHDDGGYQPSILSEPQYCLTPQEIKIFE